MISNATIFTFDEMERIRTDLDNMIDNAKSGAYMEQDAKTVCEWLIKNLTDLRKQFE